MTSQVNLQGEALSLENLEGGDLALMGSGSLPSWSSDAGWGAVLSTDSVLFVVMGQVLHSAQASRYLGEYLRSAALVTCSATLGPVGVLKKLRRLAATLDPETSLEVLCAAIYPSRRLLQVAGMGWPPAPLVAQEGRVMSLELPEASPLGDPSVFEASGQRAFPLASGSVVALLGGPGTSSESYRQNFSRALGSCSLAWTLGRPHALDCLCETLPPGVTLLTWLAPIRPLVSQQLDPPRNVG